MSIFGYDELEEQYNTAKECQVAISEGTDENSLINVHALLDNFAMILKSHMNLQERNEELRKANTSLVDKIKGIKYVLRVK